MSLSYEWFMALRLSAETPLPVRHEIGWHVGIETTPPGEHTLLGSSSPPLLEDPRVSRLPGGIHRQVRPRRRVGRSPEVSPR